MTSFLQLCFHHLSISLIREASESYNRPSVQAVIVLGLLAMSVNVELARGELRQLLFGDQVIEADALHLVEDRAAVILMGL